MSRSRNGRLREKPAKKRPNKGKSAPARTKKDKRTRIELEGVLTVNREGYGFVSVEGRDDDIFVPAKKMRRALNGDKVLVSAIESKNPDKKPEGEVIKIIERSKRPHVGILQAIGNQAWVIVESKNMPYDISIPSGKYNPEDNGKKVAALVTDWPANSDDPTGIITDVLGTPGDNNTEMHAILAEYGLPYRFEKEVEAAAGKISSRITKKEISLRKDYRDVCTFTIDPADAKDFDDAISIRKEEDGTWEVGVHIADVTHYVLPGSIIDKEAYERGTSVYLVDRTVPMLPEKLSNRLCSLRPGEEKLTFSAIFKMDDKARVLSRWFGRTVIKSDYRFDYDSAQDILKGGNGPLKNELLQLWDLASQMRKRRFESGAILFDRPEMKIEVDKKGKPIRITEKTSFEANWLIEEFMLLANREVAEEVGRRMKLRNPVFVYRVHDEPDMDKVGKLRGFITHFGYRMNRTENPRELAMELNKLLEKVKGKPEAEAVEIIALRSMARAKYSTDNIGHYGLGFDYYTHFTSPIRRYPDMMVHRLLAGYMNKEKPGKKEVFEQRCKYSSEREQIATEAERSSIKYKMVEFMTDKIGNIYEGTISGVTEWGIYVEIDETKVEGMVSLRDITDDYFEFSEEDYCVYGRSSGRKFRLGDRVKIRVLRANLEQKTLDYGLVDDEAGKPDGGIDSGPSKKEPAGEKKAASRKSRKSKSDSRPAKKKTEERQSSAPKRRKTSNRKNNQPTK